MDVGGYGRKYFRDRVLAFAAFGVAIAVYTLDGGYPSLYLAASVAVGSEVSSKDFSYLTKLDLRPYFSVALALLLSRLVSDLPGLGVGGVAAAVSFCLLRRRLPFFWCFPPVYLVVAASTYLEPSAASAVSAVAVCGVFAAASYFADVTDLDGSLAGFGLAFLTATLLGYRWLAVLGVFLASSAAATKYKRREKVELGVDDGGETRGFSNVAANGGVAAVAAVLSGLGFPEIAGLVFAGSLSSATADTLSSELGSVSGEPHLITTWEKVPPGTDGAVSAVGEVVAAAASATIAASVLALNLTSLTGAAAVAAGGIAGVHFDSLLGASVEGHWLNNSLVNLSACIVGAVATVLVWSQL